MHSFFIHPLNLPTSEIWVGYTLSCSNRAAKVHQILMSYRLRIRILKKTFRAATVQQSWSKRDPPLQSGSTHSQKVGFGLLFSQILKWVDPPRFRHLNTGWTHCKQEAKVTSRTQLWPTFKKWVSRVGRPTLKRWVTFAARLLHDCCPKVLFQSAISNL